MSESRQFATDHLIQKDPEGRDSQPSAREASAEFYSRALPAHSAEHPFFARLAQPTTDRVGRRLPRAPSVVIVAGDALALTAATVLLHDAVRWTESLMLFLVLLPAANVHTRIDLQLARDLPRLLGRMIVAFGLIALFSNPASWLQLLFMAGAVVSTRFLTYSFLRLLRAQGRMLKRTLIVGAGDLGQQVAKCLTDHPEYGLIPVGFMDVKDRPGIEFPVLAHPEDILAMVDRLDVCRVIIAYGATPESDLVPIIRQCQRLRGLEVYVVPRFFELNTGSTGSGADNIWGTALTRLPRRALRSPAWRAKRLLDIALASLLLVLLAPLLVIIASVVYVSLGRPILFRQHRVGQSGRVFEILKFRTYPLGGMSDTEWTPDRKQCSGSARLLRRTGLDELPQLINVVRGDMSLVGPRPERPHFAVEFAEHIANYNDRLRVPAGITGLAQVNGLVGDTSISERTRFDNKYIEDWSPSLDFLILLRTMMGTLRGGKAR